MNASIDCYKKGVDSEQSRKLLSYGSIHTYIYHLSTSKQYTHKYIVYQQTSNDNSNNLLEDFAYVHGTLHYTKERPSFPFFTTRQRIN
jgi:hypothetical protein